MPHGLSLLDAAFVASTTPSLSPAAYGTLAGWWKADYFNLSDGASIGGTGVEWNDLSGNGLHLSQSNASLRPVFKTAIFGSKPAIRFDGSNDELSMASTLTSTRWTIVVVCTVNADSIILGGNSYQVRIMRSAANTISYYDNSNDNVSQTLTNAANTVRMLSWKRDNSDNLFFRENKTDKSPGQTTTIALSVNKVGRTDYGQFFDGDVAELIVFSESVSTTNLNLMYDEYLQPKWGLP